MIGGQGRNLIESCAALHVCGYGLANDHLVRQGLVVSEDDVIQNDLAAFHEPEAHAVLRLKQQSHAHVQRQKAGQYLGPPWISSSQ